MNRHKEAQRHKTDQRNTVVPLVLFCGLENKLQAILHDASRHRIESDAAKITAINVVARYSVVRVVEQIKKLKPKLHRQ